MTALRFFKAKDLEVAWVDARIGMTVTKTDTSAKHESQDDDDKMKGMVISCAHTGQRL